MKKVILITGCSSGIGLATSVYLAQQGFQVVATMRDLSKKAALESALASAQVKAELQSLDVTDVHSIEACLKAVQQKFGRLDAVVNNAGFTIDGFFEDLSDEDVRRLFEVNFFGVLEVARQALSLMRAQKSGRLITIGSIAGQFALPQVGIYSAAKFALEGWTEALRYEVAPFNIQVSIIEPCFVQTQLGTTNRQVGAYSDDPKSAYTPFNAAMDHFYENYDKHYSKKPEAVARLVYKALVAKHPKIRYMLGRREKLFFALKRILPQRTFEKIYNRVFPKLKHE